LIEGGGVVFFFWKRRIQDKVCHVQNGGNEDDIRDLIIELEPHLLRIGRTYLGRGVSQHDDEYAILLNAAHRAIQTFNPSEAQFMSYLQTVCKHALWSHIKKEKVREKYITIPEEMPTEQICGPVIEQSFEEKVVLQEELLEFKEKLAKQGITWQLVSQARPKHEQKRAHLKQIAQQLHSLELADWFLSTPTPPRKIAEQLGVTQRYLKQNRIFLVALVLILKEDDSGLKSMFWQKGGDTYDKKRSCR
jgi:DNA-directed RNA polymerase specialized sigma subunit